MNIESIKQQLREGVEKGYWTIDQLDRPSAGFQACTKVDRRIFAGGYEGVQFRNLLRASPPVVEKVQVIDNKDLPPMPTGHTPAQTPKLPLTLDEEESRTQVQAGTTSQAACDLHEPDELRPASGFEALPW